jgi:DNA modification methylase
MGSGTTARMAFDQDRDYIGFEIDPTFHKLCEEINEEEMNKGRLPF